MRKLFLILSLLVFISTEAVAQFIGGGSGDVTDVLGTTNEITSTNSGGPQPTLSIASTFDISGKTSTKPVKTGTTAPATCGVGELFFDTDATAGQNIYACTATNTWTLTGDGGGSGGTAGSPLFVQTATATAVTSATETTLLAAGAGSLTIPVNWFTNAGAVMDVRFSGKYTTAAAPGTLQLKLKFGTTVVAQTAAFTPLASVTDGIYSGFIRLIARTVGATGTIFVADGILTTGSTLTPGEIIFSNPTLGTAVTIDTTATQVVDLTATWGTGATNSITGYTFEMVGPGSAVSSVFGQTGAVPNLSGDVTTSGSSVTTIAANSVALTTDTTGNYVADVADGAGIDVTGTPGEGWTATVNLLYTDTLAGNPAMGADECRFSTDGTGGGLICEGTVADTNEGLVVFPFTTSDKTITFFDATDTVVGRATTDTLTNKTFDAEGTGNVLTIPVNIWLPGASCTNATAGLLWDTPTTNPAVAACVTGTNTQKGVLDFADGANALSVQQTLLLPSDATGTVDAKFKWFSSVTTGDVVWQIATICVADAETDDPAFNTASTVTDTTKGTANQTNDASITGVTVTGCAAGELLHVKVTRDPAHASDTMAGTARLIGVELTLRRAM